jgi:cathepsin L
MTDSDLRTILSSHPVVAHFKAETAFTSYSKGVYSCSPNTTTAELNHAVSVIGYDNSNNYIIKNSWN